MSELSTELRAKIDAFEQLMADSANSIDLDVFEVKHYFTDTGLYAREMILPAGSIVSGKIKKHEHISIISAGFCTEVTEAGVNHIHAPCTMVSRPDTKRIVLAHETTVWTTVHFTTETDLAKVEEQLISKQYLKLPPMAEQLNLFGEEVV